MNEFQGIESGKGLLKSVYDSEASKISDALKKLRKKRREKGMERLDDDAIMTGDET